MIRKIIFIGTLFLSLLVMDVKSQVAPFNAFYAVDTNGSPDCQHLDTMICFTIFQHSGILDAVSTGLVIIEYFSQSFAPAGWYSDDAFSFYYWTGSSWDPCVEFCGIPPIAISGDTIVNAYTTTNYSVIDTAGSSFYWSVTNGSIVSGQSTDSVQIQWSSQGSGIVNLVETTALTCVKYLNLSVTILGNASISDQNERFISVYPNPSNELININYVGTYEIPYTYFFDNLGELLRVCNSNTINIEDLPNGCYHLKVVYGSKTKDVTFIKH